MAQIGLLRFDFQLQLLIMGIPVGNNNGSGNWGSTSGMTHGLSS